MHNSINNIWKHRVKDVNLIMCENAYNVVLVSVNYNADKVLLNKLWETVGMFKQEEELPYFWKVPSTVIQVQNKRRTITYHQH